MGKPTGGLARTMDATQAIVAALQGLNRHSRERVLKAAAVLVGCGDLLYVPSDDAGADDTEDADEPAPEC